MEGDMPPRLGGASPREAGVTGISSGRIYIIPYVREGFLLFPFPVPAIPSLQPDLRRSRGTAA